MNILISAPIRNSGETLPEYLKSILELDYDKKKIGIFFLLNDSTDISEQRLRDFQQKYAGFYKEIVIDQRDFGVPYTARIYRNYEFYSRMADLRNGILDHFIKKVYYQKIFFLDSDIKVNKKSLIELIKTRKSIVSLLVQNNKKGTIFNIGSYTDKFLYGINPKQGLFQVDITGAACLVDRKIVETGCRFEGNENGEDVPFCLSARRNGYTVWCLNKSMTTHLSMEENWKIESNITTKKVAVSCHTGIGDAILASAFITELKRTPEVVVDVFTWQYGMEVFPANPNIRNIFRERVPSMTLSKKYDDIYLMENPIFKKISLSKDLKYKQAYRDYLTLINSNKEKRDEIVWNDFIQDSALKTCDRLFGINPSISQSYLDCDMLFANKAPKKYAVIHDWAARGKQTKNWIPQHWISVVKFLKDMGLLVYQVGEAESDPIEGSISLLGQTTVKQSFGLLKNADIYIGIDSSMTHAAAVLGTPCISIWGPTSVNYWGHTENVNLIADGKCKNCWGYYFGENWWDSCVRNKGRECMAGVTSDMVIEAVCKLLPGRSINIPKIRKHRIVVNRSGAHGDVLGISVVVQGLNEKYENTDIVVRTNVPHVLENHPSVKISREPVSEYDEMIELDEAYESDPLNYKKHFIDIYCEKSMVIPFERKPIYIISEKEKKWAEKFLSNAGALHLRKVGIVLRATHMRARCWLPERTNQLARTILDRGLLPVSFGTNADGNLTFPGPLQTQGKTSFREAIALLSFCELVVTPDTGLLHFAAAVGVPQIGMFSTVDPYTRMVYGGDWDVIRKSPCVIPCRINDNKILCLKNQNCMANITVSDVMDIVDRRMFRKKTVSIIIPVYGAFDDLKNCLASIKSTCAGIDYEIIIVDDGSGESIPVLETERIRVISFETNRGFGATCNSGARISSGEFILFLNSDTIATKPGWIETMIRTFDEFDRVGIVGIKLLYPDGTIQHAGMGKYGDNYVHMHANKPGNHPPANVVKEVGTVTGAAIMLKREAFFSVNGFDERYRMYSEDTDLALKIRKTGKKVIYQPKAVLYHLESMSSKKMPEIEVVKKQSLDFMMRRWKDHFKNNSL